VIGLIPQYTFRKSCNGVLVRLRVNPGDNSWLVIERKGSEREYIDIKDSDVEDVLARFNAITTPDDFSAFVASVSP
jgi:hypothetical protein